MEPFPACDVQLRPLARVVPYGKNARVHSPAQIAQIAASIGEWGFTMPVLVDVQGTLIAGHARLEAARAVGLEEIPVMVARGWSQAQIKAYRLAERSTWSDEFLRTEFTDLDIENFDLSLLGWTGNEIDALLLDKTEGKTDPDAVPADVA